MGSTHFSKSTGHYHGVGGNVVVLCCRTAAFPKAWGIDENCWGNSSSALLEPELPQCHPGVSGGTQQLGDSRGCEQNVLIKPPSSVQH